MGGFILEDRGTFKVVTVDKHGFACIAALNSGESSERYTGILPAISEEELNDKAKGDWLTKLLAVLQTTWFIVRCIVRRVEGLALTELELVTLAFAVLNGFAHALWRSKPMNGGYPVYFKMNGERCYGPRYNWKEGWGTAEAHQLAGTEFHEWTAWLSRATGISGKEISDGLSDIKARVSKNPAFALVVLLCSLLIIPVITPLVIMVCFWLLQLPLMFTLYAIYEHLAALVGLSSQVTSWPDYHSINRYTLLWPTRLSGEYYVDFRIIDDWNSFRGNPPGCLES
ncbi:hypothetical protein AX16_010136 [Volvariella volvacea WC 439]|nr:hypothetical protein AX16_010136 [Volvariella volvacea WC 439]